MLPTRHYPDPAVRVKLSTGRGTGWHDHDRPQLLYPGTGAVSVTTVTGTWVVPPLRAMWLPAGQAHEHRAHGPTQLCSLLLSERVSPFDGPTLVEVSPLLREAVLALTSGVDLATDGEADKMQRRYLEAIVCGQLRPAAEVACYLPEPRDDRLRAIGAMLRADTANEQDLAGFGRQVGASARTLSRLYAAQTGMSFPRWRARLRIQQSCLALADGRSITAVAHTCGYSTVSAFTQAFHQHTGMTPGRYRAQATT